MNLTNLQNLSTFRIPNLSASQIITISSIDDITDLINNNTLKQYSSRLIVGGGSNIVFTKDFDGLILLNQLK